MGVCVCVIRGGGGRVLGGGARLQRWKLGGSTVFDIKFTFGRNGTKKFLYLE